MQTITVTAPKPSAQPFDVMNLLTQAQHGMLAAPSADPFESWGRVPDPEKRSGTAVLDSLAASQQTSGQRAAGNTTAGLDSLPPSQLTPGMRAAGVKDPFEAAGWKRVPDPQRAPQGKNIDPVFGLDLDKYNRSQPGNGEIDPVTGLDLSKYQKADAPFDVNRTLALAQHGMLPKPGEIDPVTGLDLSKYAQPVPQQPQGPSTWGDLGTQLRVGVERGATVRIAPAMSTNGCVPGRTSAASWIRSTHR
jgi:hypothetical protein